MTRPGAFRAELVELIRARHPVILVETQEPERVVATLLEVAADASAFPRGRRVLEYSVTNGIHAPGSSGEPAHPTDAVRALVRMTEPTVLVAHDVHHFLGAYNGAPDAGLIRALYDAAESCKNGFVPHTVVLVSPRLYLVPDLEKIVTVVDLPLPDAGEIAEVLDEIVEANRDQIVVDLSEEDGQRLVDAARGLTRWEAENAFARAIVADGVLDATDIPVVMDEKRQTIRKSGLLEFLSPSSTIDDIGGLENLKRWLRKRASSWLPEAQEWSVPAPKGILITGVPGCGKSLTAKCIADLWGLPLLRLDVGRVFSGLVGSSELNMRSALKLAEAVAPSVLWIDEIEKGFGSMLGNDAGTTQRVFGSFLTWMQEKTQPVFVVAVANRIDYIPAEFLRKGRFDEVFFVDLPTHAERFAVWRLHLERRLAGKPRLAQGLAWSDLLIDELAAASDGFSGAEIEQVVVTACFEAFADRRPMVGDDLHRAIRQTVPLSVTQAEQVAAVREWATARAVSATAESDLDGFPGGAPRALPR